MATPSHRLRETIVSVIIAADSRAVHVDELYRTVEASVALDAEDLAPAGRGRSKDEPAWKKHVREVLQEMKREGSLVNSPYKRWRLPSPDPARYLDPSTAWPEVHREALEVMKERRELTSPKQGRRYRVAEVGAKRIVIERRDADESATLTAGDVTRAIHFLNAAGGRAGRRTLLYTVAEEVSLVCLHPRLGWDANRDWIEVITGGAPEPARPVYLDFGEAPNDDPVKLAQFARRVRAGQPRFRRNLLAAYGERCAITGWGPADVLEAAHILLHAHTGLNETDNGLLLRSDLHILFDEGLLRIDPDTLRVWLDPSLRGTPYWDWNGAALRPRVDGRHPSREYLRSRWQSPGAAPELAASGMRDS